MPDYSIGFIGSGQMARALASGFVKLGGVAGDSICFVNPGDRNSELFQQAAVGSIRIASTTELVVAAEQVWVAVKPQMMKSVLEHLLGKIPDQKLMVSVAAGVKLLDLREWSGHDRWIRTSPNTPCLVGAGITVLAASEPVHDREKTKVQSLLQSVGSVWDVPERLIDPISGLTSCGPAFVMTILEGLSDGAVRAGVPRGMANQMAIDMVLGSTRLAKESGLHPSILREQVASPAGSTIEGLLALEDGGIRSALMHAVSHSAKRAAELGQG